MMKRALPAIVVLALFAGACGGETEVSAEAQAQIDELQAQVDKLAAEAEDAATTTAAPVETTTTAAPAETTTTAAPAETTTTAAPAETTTTAAPAESGTVDDAASTSAPVEGRLDATMGPDEAAALLDSLIGPTNDMAGAIAKVDFAWPAVSTLPDTEITAIKTTIAYNTFDEAWEQRMQVEFLTSASPQDATLAYQTELAALFPEGQVSTSTQQDDGRVTEFAGVGRYDIAAAVQDSGQTFVRFVANSTDRVLAPDALEALTGLAESSFANDDPEAFFSELQMWHFLGSADIEVEHSYVGVFEADLKAEESSKATAAGWTFDREYVGFNEYVIPEVDTVGTVKFREFTNSSDDVTTTFVTIDYDYG